MEKDNDGGPLVPVEEPKRRKRARVRVDATPVATVVLEQAPRSSMFARGDSERARNLLYQRAGIPLFPVKHESLYQRLLQRVEAAGARDFSDYLDRLEGGDATEFEAFVSSLTRSTTGFFRDPAQFEVLAQRLKAIGPRRPIRIWTCAAGSGEEAYSIAMTAVEAFGTWAPPVNVVASDNDNSSLELARSGIYPADKVRQLETTRAQRYFIRGSGEFSSGYRVRPELQSLMRFRRIDLTDPAWPVHGPYDAIFCRNVLGYVADDLRERVVRKLASYLRTDGLLFVGPTEVASLRNTSFRPRGNSVYELGQRQR